MLMTGLNNPNGISKRKVRSYILRSNLDTYPNGGSLLEPIMPPNEAGDLNSSQISSMIAFVDRILNPARGDDVIVLSTSGPGYEFR